MTKTEAAAKFNAYFADLRNENERDGAKVCRRDEWQFFVSHLIDLGDLSDEARNWSCPRNAA